MCARSLTENVRSSLIDRFNFNTLTNLRGLCLKFLLLFLFLCDSNIDFRTYICTFVPTKGSQGKYYFSISKN